MKIEIIETKIYFVTLYTEEELETTVWYNCFNDATEITKAWVEDNIEGGNDWDYLTENADNSERISIKVNKIKIIKDK